MYTRKPFSHDGSTKIATTGANREQTFSAGADLLRVAKEDPLRRFAPAPQSEVGRFVRDFDPLAELRAG